MNSLEDYIDKHLEWQGRKGDVLNSHTSPSGCRFHTRCPFSLPICHNLEPTFESIEPHHFATCHHSHEVENLVA
jgi:oligopeptide/dipeptide ABC transporter ATP-binding protein